MTNVKHKIKELQKGIGELERAIIELDKNKL